MGYKDSAGLNRLRRIARVTLRDAYVIEKKTGLPNKFKKLNIIEPKMFGKTNIKRFK